MDLFFTRTVEEDTPPQTNNNPTIPGYVQVSAPWLGPFNIDGNPTEFMVKDHGTHPSAKSKSGQMDPEREKTIGDLVKHWDGQKVWGLMEDGMWRQATVVATVPPKDEDKDDPRAPWTFILGTKHDVWRHVITAVPTDDSDLEFETIHVAEFADSDLMSEALIKQYDFAPAYPEDAPKMDLGDYKCPIHPFVASYIRKLKHIIEKRPSEAKIWREKYEEKCNEFDRLKEKQMEMFNMLREKGSGAPGSVAPGSVAPEEAAITTARTEQSFPMASSRSVATGISVVISPAALTGPGTVAGGGAGAGGASGAELLAAKDMLVKKEKEIMKLHSVIAERDRAMAEMGGDRGQLVERIKVLDDCLRRTILADSEATSRSAVSHAKQQARLQAEVDRLVEQVTVLKNGRSNSVGGDFQPISMVPVDFGDDSALREEISSLKYALAQAAELNFDVHVAELKSMQSRLSALESMKGSMVPDDLIAMSAEELKAMIAVLHEETQAKMKKDMRKVISDRIRMASLLKDEIAKVRGRVELLETRKGIKVVDPLVDDSDPVWAALTPMVMMTRQEMQTLKLSEAKLKKDNAKLLTVLKASKVCNMNVTLMMIQYACSAYSSCIHVDICSMRTSSWNFLILYAVS
jgi:hypothetical protein